MWLPFLIAFLVALITAFSYLELVTKYPQAAGAALYTHKAFGIHFLTFLVAFAVMSSGITSASTAARAFSANAAAVFDLDLGEGIGITLIGLGFMTLVALVNFRGVGESVKANVVLTCVELTGLLIIIGIGVWALGIGEGDFSRVTEFDTGDKSVLTGVIAATGLAFFAMVGFEDSVNMAEECKEPRRIFPKVLLLGPRHHRPDLRAGLDLGDRARAGRPAQRGRDPAAAGRGGRRARASRSGCSASSRCSPSPTPR